MTRYGLCCSSKESLFPHISMSWPLSVQYSFHVIPRMGQVIANDFDSYQVCSASTSSTSLTTHSLLLCVCDLHCGCTHSIL